MKSTVILLAAAAALILILTACVRNQPNQEDDPPADPVPSGKTASLSFDSFDGGGPTYSVSIEDPSIASVSEGGAYDDPDHEEIDGAGYSVTFVFTGLKPGETYANVSARSPIADNFDRRYAVIVAEDLSVTLELLTEEDLNSGAIQPRAHLVLSVNGKVFYPEPEENSSAQAFLAKLEEEGGSVELAPGTTSGSRPSPAISFCIRAIRSRSTTTRTPGNSPGWQGSGTFRKRNCWKRSETETSRSRSGWNGTSERESARRKRSQSRGAEAFLIFPRRAR